MIFRLLKIESLEDGSYFIKLEKCIDMQKTSKVNDIEIYCPLNRDYCKIAAFKTG